jgi:hypothetical protein
MDILTLLTLGYTIGGVIAAGGATMLEVLVTRAYKDGRVNVSEGSLLTAAESTIRTGFVVVLLSGLGFLLYHKTTGQAQFLWSSLTWAAITIIGVLAFNMLVAHRKQMSIELGSSISLVSWYALLIMTVVGNPMNATYVHIMIGYIALIIAGTFILDQVRKLFGTYI